MSHGEGESGLDEVLAEGVVIEGTETLERVKDVVLNDTTLAEDFGDER